MKYNIKEKFIDQMREMNFEQTFVKDIQCSKLYTYDEFFSDCMEICDYLDLQEKNKNIIAILENSVFLAKLYFVALLSNRVIFVIDPQKEKSEINEILKSIAEGILIKEDAVQVDNETFVDVSGMVRNINREDVPIDYNIKEIIINKLIERNFDDCYLVTYTSGTTGVSKGVMNSLANLLYTAYALQEKVQAPKRSSFLHVMPMTYMAGILNSIFYPLISELELVITDRFNVKTAIRFWNIVEENEITVFWLSPMMLMLIDQVDRKSKGVEYCKNHKMYFMIGTAALTDSLREKFENRYEVELLASYGLSETLFVSIETSQSKKICNKNNVGELLEGVKYLIKDGELYVDVPWMFLGYANTDTDEYFYNEFYKSGDLVEIENDILYITGRKKDLIVRGGMNISPAKIESVINEIDAVVECAVVAVKNKYNEEQVCCVYVVNSELCETEIEMLIRKKVLEELGKNYRIDVLKKLVTLPRNINGKIDKEKIKKHMN